MPVREGSIRVSLTGSKKPYKVVSEHSKSRNEDVQRTGPVKVLLDFVDHVPTILASVTWAEATLPKARVAVRAYAEGSLMSVALCVRRFLVFGRRVSRQLGYGLVVYCSRKANRIIGWKTRLSESLLQQPKPQGRRRAWRTQNTEKEKPASPCPK